MQFHRVTEGPSRGLDSWGSGQFGAGRGGHIHRGLDIVTDPGQRVLSPIDGDVVREALPYRGDLRYRRVLIMGSGQWNGYEVKIFYVDGIRSGGVAAGTRSRKRKI